LVVWKLDRLGRTVKQLVDLVTELRTQKKVNFKSITDGIDTTTTAGRFFFNIMASLAEMEQELTAERTKAGLAVAKKLGRFGGLSLPLGSCSGFGAKELIRHNAGFIKAQSVKSGVTVVVWGAFASYLAR